MSGLVGRRCQVGEYDFNSADAPFMPMWAAVVQHVFSATSPEDAPSLLVERVENGALHVVELQDVMMVPIEEPAVEYEACRAGARRYLETQRAGTIATARELSQEVGV